MTEIVATNIIASQPRNGNAAARTNYYFRTPEAFLLYLLAMLSTEPLQNCYPCQIKGVSVGCPWTVAWWW